MAIITLTTDWNTYDYYVGSLKGKILSKKPDVEIVDLSHHVQVFNIAEAAFIVRNSYPNFPKGTVHVIGVNSEIGEDDQYIAIKYEGHYFIYANNGIHGLIFENEKTDIRTIDIKKEKVSRAFLSLEVFSEWAVRLTEKGAFEKLGAKTQEIARHVPMRAVIEDSVISGSVIYIDTYQNAITNISMDLFEQVGMGRPFEIFVQSNYYKLKKINKTYSETSVGELLAIFNSVGLLEIAIKNGNACELLNLGTHSTVRIKFYSK